MANPSDRQIREAFKRWALKKITSTPGHPLQCLVNDLSDEWHPNLTGFPDRPSIDAGHTTSKWTGAPPALALEDSDFNRTFNRGENKTRDGVFFRKEAVLIGGVPVEKRTATMLENTGKLKPGTVAASPAVNGAVYSTEKREFTVEAGKVPGPATATQVPGIRSNVSGRSRIGSIASNQDVVALGWESAGSVSTYFAYKGIVARQVQDELRTTHAEEIRRIHAGGDGVLVIMAIQTYAQPSPDYRLENPQLISVNVIGGANVEEAMTKWTRQTRIRSIPPQYFRIDDSYIWLARPKK